MCLSSCGSSSCRRTSPSSRESSRLSTDTRTHALDCDADLVDRAAADPLELRAQSLELTYVKLDGEVGIVGRGAGLVMSPLDVAAYAGTLTYQMMCELHDSGFSTCVGIGGDPIVGENHVDYLAAFETDSATGAIVMIGEIGGDAEEWAEPFIAECVTKPVFGTSRDSPRMRARRWVTRGRSCRP